VTILYDDSYYSAYADSVILAEIHAKSGSDAISTETTIKDTCWVTVDIVITANHHAAIYHRNNPDKTFYPGDAFDYSINTGTIGCRHFQPCPLQSTANLLGVPHGPNCITHGHDGDENPVGGTYGAAANSGTATVNPAIGESESVSLSKMASAEQWICHKAGDEWHCGWNTVSASAGYFPPVILPHLEVTIEKDGYEFTEDDGYISRNLDKTYYVWDAINLVHNPLYKWKNDRVGTIFVEIAKDYSPLTLEDEFQCELASCVNTMSIPGFKPWTGTFDYGSGNTVYNATDLSLIGEHIISYNTKLFNITPQIDENDNSTSALVVEYEPIYDSYVYPVLSDDQRLALHDRMGIALHYFGSQSTDANPDDTIGIHEDRRSKINDYFYSTWGADPWEFEFLDGTTPIETDYSDDIDLTWDEAHDVGIVVNEMPVKISEDISDQLIATEFAGIIPFEVERHSTANFVKSGYGKIFFDYPGLYEVVLDTEKKIPRFENATVFDTLQSTNFAGHDVSHLSFSEYMYPESFFYNKLSATAVDSDGSQDDSVLLTLEIIPRLDIPGTQYLDEYMQEKILFDTQDDGFSQIITGLDIDGNDIVVPNGHDIYSLDDTEATSFGSVNIEKTRRTLSSFTQYDIIQDQTFANDDVTDISDKYLLDTEDAILPIPLTTGLDALSPFTISVTGYNGIYDVTNTFDQTWYDFSVDYFYLVNMDIDNTLDIKRDTANPRVLLYTFDENFGEIKSLDINGVVFSDDDLPECFKIKSVGTCVISAPSEHQLAELNITAQNMWMGKATATLPEIDQTQLNPTLPDPVHFLFEGIVFDWMIIVLVMMLVVYFVYKIVRWYKRNP